MTGRRAIVPITTHKTPLLYERTKGYSSWRWDFHEDCPDYEAQLKQWGWIKPKSPPLDISALEGVLKEVWTTDRLESQFYSPGGVIAYRTTNLPLTWRKRCAKVWRWLKI